MAEIGDTVAPRGTVHEVDDSQTWVNDGLSPMERIAQDPTASQATPAAPSPQSGADTAPVDQTGKPVPVAEARPVDETATPTETVTDAQPAAGDTPSPDATQDATPSATVASVMTPGASE